MRKLLLLPLLGFVLADCGRDEVTYRPHFDPKAVKQEPKKEESTHPKRDPNEHVDIVEKVGDVDLAKYGIPMSPGSKVKENRPVEVKPGQPIQVTLESYDRVLQVADWYKTRIEATDAVGDPQLASLKGTTLTNYPIEISIVDIEGKVTISLTVSPQPLADKDKK